jgi:O-antigen/teichoic acid export membrane protein
VASFASQLVLARLLLPEAFGQIGMAYTVTTLAAALISFGVDAVLLQRLRTFKMWASPAFWSSLALSLLGMALMLAAAPVAGRMYHSPDLFGLVAVLAIALPIAALPTVPYVKLRAAMDFRFLATYSSGEMLAVQVASVALGGAGLRRLQLRAARPFAAAVKAAVFWRKAPTRIRPASAAGRSTTSSAAAASCSARG